MSVSAAYKNWSEIYDTNENKTRDLEGFALKDILDTIHFDTCLEIGSGTGKNTVWLETKASQITAIDLSVEMIEKAKSKVKTQKVYFAIADINKDWSFAKDQYDLATFSLVLEHIQNIEAVFEKLAKVIKPNGHVYIGELHPFKQYAGSQARYNDEYGEQQLVEAYTHHITDFTNAGLKHGFKISMIKEYFDNDDKSTIPRILALLLQKTT